MTKVSVIIPCFNQVHWIDDAVQSVLAQTYKDFEIIIVNDGSTEPQTNSILNSYDNPCIKVIHTVNQGVATARNTGISQATGIYILPLDADDKIADSYIQKAVGIMESNPNIGIVYCQAEFFGDETGKWELPEYSFPEILLGNVIFCSGFYRKSDWDYVQGYNPNMKYGLADYDFWLSLINLGKDVFRIQESLFMYRQRSGSMSKSITREQRIQMVTQLFENHSKLYSENISVVFRRIFDLNDQVNLLGNNVRELRSMLDQLQKERLEIIQNQTKYEKVQEKDIIKKLTGLFKRK